MASKPLVEILASLQKRDASDADPDEPEADQKEVFSSWALFILIALLIAALFTSYLLQTRRIQAVHETVVSIFAGMFVGLILRLTAAQSVLGAVSFDYQFFFNLLLPPIILASGYELHQENFFRNIGTILTFAFAGTFISAVILGVILFLWALMRLEGISLTFIEAMSVGATLSATDPVTVLAIFNTYKVDPSLYTVIFGESILNDAIAIVLFNTAQQYKDSAEGDSFTIFTFFQSIGTFLGVFFGSLIFGIIVGVATSLLLKFTLVRRFPKIESCLVFLIAYSSYFFSNAIHMSGIVSLLFCGICMKHYAHHNMSRRTQLSTKYIFQILAQLAENFIFIYLGLSLLTETDLEYKPLFILVTVIGICVARWCVVFPLSSAINWVIRYRARRQGREAVDQLPYSHQAMLFWAGLRGAVGVALAAGLSGANGSFLRATVLVVVVLTVIIFGGTTARMLEILGIRTGVVDEMDSDDEFDIEIVNGGNGSYARRSGNAFGHTPRYSQSFHPNGLPLNGLVTKDGRYTSTASTDPDEQTDGHNTATYSSGIANVKGANGTDQRSFSASRRNSARNIRTGKLADGADQGLLSPNGSSNGQSNSMNSSINLKDDDASASFDEFDLPPAAPRKSPSRHLSPRPEHAQRRQASSPSASSPAPAPATSSPFTHPAYNINNSNTGENTGLSRGATPDRSTTGTPAQSTPASTSAAGRTGSTIRQLISDVSEDPATLFKQLDEGFIKPHLLLDPHRGSGGGGGGGV